MKVSFLTQLGLALLLGLVFLVGDRSHPSVGDVSERIGVTDPIVLHFDRPVNRASLERSFRLAGEEPVAGTFRWSTRSVAFIPDAPLRHSSSYTLVVGDFEDAAGRHSRRQFSRTIRTSPARFLYLTPARSLMLYLVDERRSVSISHADERVLDYAVTPDGTTAFVSYFQASDTALFGLFAVTLDWNGPTHRREVREHDPRRIFRLLLCDAGLTALVYEDEMRQGAPGANERLLAVPVFGKRLAFDQARVLLSGDALEATEGFPHSLTCSPSSDRFLYADPNRQILLGSLHDPTDTTALGFYQQVYGFSPAEIVLLSQRQDGASAADAVVLALDPQTGGQTLLGESGTAVFDPALTADEAWLAVAEVRQEQSGTSSASFISLYHFGSDPQRNQDLSRAPPAAWDEQPTWSQDDRSLAFVRQYRTTELSAAINGRGRLLGGSLHLVTFVAEIGDGESASFPVELGITGGQITWLP